MPWTQRNEEKVLILSISIDIKYKITEVAINELTCRCKIFDVLLQILDTRQFDKEKTDIDLSKTVNIGNTVITLHLNKMLLYISFSSLLTNRTGKHHIT